MNVQISYDELANYVQVRYMIRPQLKRVEDKTIQVSFRVGCLIVPIVLKIHIEAMRKDVVCLSYECSPAIAMLIAGVIGHCDKMLPEGVELNADDKRVNIFLSYVEGVQKAIEYVELKDIHMKEEGLELVANLCGNNSNKL